MPARKAATGRPCSEAQAQRKLSNKNTATKMAAAEMPPAKLTSEQQYILLPEVEVA
jgi:hypothetical protein